MTSADVNRFDYPCNGRSVLFVFINDLKMVFWHFKIFQTRQLLLTSNRSSEIKKDVTDYWIILSVSILDVQS